MDPKSPDEIFKIVKKAAACEDYNWFLDDMHAWIKAKRHWEETGRQVSLARLRAADRAIDTLLMDGILVKSGNALHWAKGKDSRTRLYVEDALCEYNSIYDFVNYGKATSTSRRVVDQHHIAREEQGRTSPIEHARHDRKEGSTLSPSSEPEPSSIVSPINNNVKEEDCDFDTLIEIIGTMQRAIEALHERFERTMGEHDRQYERLHERIRKLEDARRRPKRSVLFIETDGEEEGEIKLKKRVKVAV